MGFQLQLIQILSTNDVMAFELLYTFYYSWCNRISVNLVIDYKRGYWLWVNIHIYLQLMPCNFNFTQYSYWLQMMLSPVNQYKHFPSRWRVHCGHAPCAPIRLRGLLRMWCRWWMAAGILFTWPRLQPHQGALRLASSRAGLPLHPAPQVGRRQRSGYIRRYQRSGYIGGCHCGYGL